MAYNHTYYNDFEITKSTMKVELNKDTGTVGTISINNVKSDISDEVGKLAAERICSSNLFYNNVNTTSVNDAYLEEDRELPIIMMDAYDNELFNRYYDNCMTHWT
ncbi:MAG: hypothetical protein ATN35_12725 [Epulopiscium sp. Nele67-Bin004]|nr:MAG: hypothetical protein ATN35_12725 [Epulopiscium sp. Nele67-Bin004]